MVTFLERSQPSFTAISLLMPVELPNLNKIGEEHIEAGWAK